MEAKSLPDIVGPIFKALGEVAITKTPVVFICTDITHMEETADFIRELSDFCGIRFFGRRDGDTLNLRLDMEKQA